MPQSGTPIQTKPGIWYAETSDQLKLPVIDLSNPAFALSLDDGDLRALEERYLQDVKGPERLPGFLRPLLFSFMRRRSVIMRGLMGASGTFMSGMNTYLLKLGAENLDREHFSDIDRTIAGSSAGTYMRLRLQDVASLVAEGVVSALQARPQAALHLLSIGGGPAIDSLNAVILLRHAHPELVQARRIQIHSLDQDTRGPEFGARALTALCGQGAPLQGLQIGFEHSPYNWSEAERLPDLVRSFADPGAVVAASSEGALFEYGSDSDVRANLQALRDVTPSDAVVVGSVTRADELGRKANGGGIGSRAALNFRGFAAFAALAAASGWTVDKVLDRPLSHDVRLLQGRAAAP